MRIRRSTPPVTRPTSRGCRGPSTRRQARHSAAVMLITQADPGFNDDQVQGAPTRNPMTLVEDDAQASTDGFGDFLRALRDQVIAFRRPVVYVHGDSHYFRDRQAAREARPDSAWRTSPDWKPSATTRRTAPTTSTGSRSWLTRAAARCSRSSLRSCRRTGPRYRLRSEQRRLTGCRAPGARHPGWRRRATRAARCDIPGGRRPSVDSQPPARISSRPATAPAPGCSPSSSTPRVTATTGLT